VQHSNENLRCNQMAVFDLDALPERVLVRFMSSNGPRA
jgi:hypothetical protein